eukprot:3053197-Amphidinium_carterae.1
MMLRPSNRFFLATFALSLFWIAMFNCVLVYCVEMLGQAPCFDMQPPREEEKKAPQKYSSMKTNGT